MAKLRINKIFEKIILINNEIQSRILVVVILTPVITLVLLSKTSTLIAGTLLVLIAAGEIFYHFYKKLITFFIAVFITLLAIILMQFPLTIFLVINCTILPLFYVALLTEKTNKLTMNLLCLTYTVIFGSNLLFLILQPTTMKYLGIVLIVSFASDIFAYAFGKKFGKRSLSKKYSKNKTWEGALGGFIFGATASLCCLIVFKLSDNIVINFLILIGLPIICQIGDITSSILKRKMKIKDYSKLLLSHGGMTDRLDSIFAAAIYVNMLFILEVM
ncbi:MAG: phosphatidate cytidylyltransferase [Dehalococcoidia bacterium]|nr:phosphatidate cytidylyltransferase [Dehalococcoidia bacterium]